MKVLVTGGTGFIGRHLVASLHAANVDVCVLDNFSNSSANTLRDLDVEITEGDILDTDLLDRMISRVDSVVHLAARGSVVRSLERPERTFRENAEGTAAVAHAASRHEAYLIVSSSSSVYGTQPIGPVSEEATLKPMSPYAASKISAEAAVESMRASFGLRALTVRFFNVYGEFQSPYSAYAAVVPRLITGSINERRVIVEGTGEQTRDFTYVGDIVNVLHQALIVEPNPEGAVNVAAGRPMSILSLLDEITQALGTSVEVEFRSARRGDIPRSCASNAKLEKLLRREVPWQRFREVVPQLIASYRLHYS